MHNYSFTLFLNSARAFHSPRQRFTDANTPFIRISRICLKVSYIHSIMIQTGFSTVPERLFRNPEKAFRGDGRMCSGMREWCFGKPGKAFPHNISG